ncbi:3094_t:CDS:2, partial [Diversispora eburnea]
ADYWVSQKKHWCQYCRIYIADNKPSRSMHEQGKKHKDNMEKFLRNIYRKEEADKKEQDKVKQELKRIEQAAMKQYKRDVALENPGANSLSSFPPPPIINTTYNLSTHSHKSYYDVSSQHEIGDESTESVIGEWRPSGGKKTFNR